MCVRSIGPLNFGLTLVFCLTLIAPHANGDSLTANVCKESFLLYEPLAVEVTVHLEEPFRPGADDPREAARQLRRLRRRFDIVLQDPNNKMVCKGLLCGAEFVPTDGPASEFTTSGLAFPQERDRGGDFVHSEHTGAYTLLVRDREYGLESNPIAITVRNPGKTRREAAEFFRSSFPVALTAILEHEGSEETLRRFDHLAREFPDTPYGEYAIVSLALMQYKTTFAAHNSGADPRVWAPVATELRKAASVFDGWHPLREKALLDLAVAYALADDIADSRRVAQTLISEFPNSKSAQKAAQLLKETRQTEER